MISCTRKKSRIVHDYVVDDVSIQKMSVVKDLGVWLDEKLNYKHHMDVTVLRRNSVLIIVKRFASEFQDPYVLKNLYYSLVRSLIEYGSVVWMPLYQVDIDRIESIQKQFLLFCLRNLGWRDRFHLPSYKQRLTLIGMIPLRDRQEVQCCTFIHDIQSGRIKSLSLQSGHSI